MGDIQSEEFLSEMHRLTPEQLKGLRDRASALLQLGGDTAAPAAATPTPGSEEEFAAVLYDAFAELHLAKTRIKRPPWKAFCASKYAAAFIEAAAGAAAANTQWFPKQTKAERVHMVRAYARIILAHLEDVGEPPFWPVITWALRDLPMLVDQAFPGYAAAGLMHKVKAQRRA